MPASGNKLLDRTATRLADISDARQAPLLRDRRGADRMIKMAVEAP